MDFERALYRVYERSLEGLRFDQPCFGSSPMFKPTVLCHGFLHLLWAMALTVFTLATVFHLNYVGEPGCLGTSLAALKNVSMAAGGVLPNGSLPLLADDEVLQIRILPAYTTYEAASHPSNNVTSFAPDYRFVKDAPLLYMKDEFFWSHNVNVINVTLDESCVAKNPMLASLVNFAGSYDTIMINQLMYSLRSDGAVKNMKTNETWGWEAEDLPPPLGFSTKVVILIKVLILIKSLLAFFLTSTITALIVRMLMSSGVILMFPLFYCLRSLGFATLDYHLLTLSYPWLGVPIQQLREENKPITPFIMAHITRVAVYYFMYESTQILLAEVLYNKSVPDGLQFMVYGVVMLWEYFSMIFLRSFIGIRFFPRISLAYFLLFHFYFYSYPYGVFGLVLLGVFLLMVHAMIYTILFLELPACQRGEVSYEQPRALYTELSGAPAWPSTLPPAWTLFLALNAHSSRVYNQDVPPRPDSMVAPTQPPGIGIEMGDEGNDDDDDDDDDDGHDGVGNGYRHGGGGGLVSRGRDRVRGRVRGRRRGADEEEEGEDGALIPSHRSRRSFGGMRIGGLSLLSGRGDGPSSSPPVGHGQEERVALEMETAPLRGGEEDEGGERGGGSHDVSRQRRRHLV